MDFEPWIKDCLKCGCPTSKIICRPCFDVIRHEPEISGFLKSEEQVFIEVRGGFIGFFCNNAWVLPKVKVKLEHSRLEPGESINAFFREHFNLELKYNKKYRMFTEEYNGLVRNTYYVDCRNEPQTESILRDAFPILVKNDIFKFYNVTDIGVLRKEGKYIVPCRKPKMHIYNDILLDDSIYNAFDINQAIKPRMILRNNVDRYNTFYKILEPRMDIVINSIRFSSWNVKQILHYTNLLWKYKYSDPCQVYCEIMPSIIFKRSDILIS